MNQPVINQSSTLNQSSGARFKKFSNPITLTLAHTIFKITVNTLTKHSWTHMALAILCCLMLTNMATVANASQPVSSIEFNGISGELANNVKANVRVLNQIRSGKPASNAHWSWLKKNVPDQVINALKPFGYYNVTLVKTSSNDASDLTYSITLGAPVMVNELFIGMNDDVAQQPEIQQWRREFPLTVGSQLNQINYESAKQRLLSKALRLGYFDARFSKHEIVINEDRTLAKIHWVFDSGPRYSVSRIDVIWVQSEGQENKQQGPIQRALLDNYIKIKPGGYFNADDLSRTQSALLETPYFSSVEVLPGEPEENETSKAVKPIVVRLTATKQKAYNAALGVGTDTGFRGSVGYENRHINDRGHHLNARIGGSSIERKAIVNYRIPLQGSIKDSINVFSSFEDGTSDNRLFESSQLGVQWSKGLNHSLVTVGLVTSRERFMAVTGDSDGVFNGDEQSTDLLMPSVHWETRVSDDLYFPTRGWSASAALRTASQDFYSDIDLTQLIFTAKVLYPLGKGRLRGRIEAAGSDIDDDSFLPLSLGFLTGGDESVRGYKFESIGQRRDGSVGIGKHLLVGSIEYEHPVSENIAVASFFDIGDAFDNDPEYKRGAGLGLRWRLPFGSMRLDAASALDRNGSPVRLHFSFGTEL